jgi:hypothetical protein
MYLQEPALLLCNEIKLRISRTGGLKQIIHCWHGELLFVTRRLWQTKVKI